MHALICVAHNSCNKGISHETITSSIMETMCSFILQMYATVLPNLLLLILINWLVKWVLVDRCHSTTKFTIADIDKLISEVSACWPSLTWQLWLLIFDIIIENLWLIIIYMHKSTSLNHRLLTIFHLASKRSYCPGWIMEWIFPSTILQKHPHTPKRGGGGGGGILTLKKDTETSNKNHL